MLQCQFCGIYTTQLVLTYPVPHAASSLSHHSPGRKKDTAYLLGVVRPAHQASLPLTSECKDTATTGIKETLTTPPEANG